MQRIIIIRFNLGAQTMNIIYAYEISQKISDNLWLYNILLILLTLHIFVIQFI
jgi:hypothetical protein